MSKQADLVRAQVRASIKQRGRLKFNIWTGYASKGGATQIVLNGTPKTQHLIWMEGDPNVVEYHLFAQEHTHNWGYCDPLCGIFSGFRMGPSPSDMVVARDYHGQFKRGYFIIQGARSIFSPLNSPLFWYYGPQVEAQQNK